jgi:hypothetical protein
MRNTAHQGVDFKAQVFAAQESHSRLCEWLKVVLVLGKLLVQQRVLLLLWYAEARKLCADGTTATCEPRSTCWSRLLLLGGIVCRVVACKL